MPSTVTPSARSRLALQHGDDLRQRGETVEHLRRVAASARRRRVGPTARASDAGRRPRRRRGRLRSRRRARARGSGSGRVSAPAVPRRGARRSSPRSPPRCPGRRGACRPRGLAQLVGGADAERPAEVDHPLRAEADQAPEPDQLGLHLGLELVDLRQAARSRPALAAVPRSTARPLAAPAPAPAGRARRPEPASRGSARRRAGTHARCSCSRLRGRAAPPASPAALRSGRCRGLPPRR